MSTSLRRSDTLRRTAIALLAAGLTAASLAACSSGGSSPSSAPADENSTLTMQFVGPPILGLDPAYEAGGTSVVYSSLAYDSLLYQQPDGTISPDLATSWKLSEGNKVLTLKIRKGVKFSDGTSLTPDAVVTWLNYFKGTAGIRNYELADMTSATASGDSVTITMSSPNPDLPLLLTQSYGAGFVASPKALKVPKSLNNASAGTGPFIFDAKQSVTGDHYTYVKNPHYWNKSAVHYGKVVVKVVSDANTILSAVQSGQLNVALGNSTTAKSAKAAGITLTTAKGSGSTALFLLDRAGQTVKALGDVRVRQAINYAIDREAIVKALQPNGYAVPTSQLLRPGQPGFSAKQDDAYPYNVKKAKQLLAEAGYPDGFTFTAMCNAALGNCGVAQAVASSLSDSGITMQIDEENQVQTFNTKFGSGTVPAVFFGTGDTTFLSAQQWLPTNSFQNSYKSTDTQLTSDFQALGSATSASAADEAATKLNDRVLELAWFAPILRTDQLFYSKGVTGVAASSKAPTYYSPVDPTGKHSWRPASK
ncbi:MAG TPA: ABC transporter substrate-binding protein [Microbacteriaceae bacterium]|nr:ABC transporter substrate-binding protein [Microbacteriaceae bacterium]